MYKVMNLSNLSTEELIKLRDEKILEAISVVQHGMDITAILKKAEAAKINDQIIRNNTN